MRIKVEAHQIEIGKQQRPSWKISGGGMARIRVHKDGKTGVALWMMEHAIESNATKLSQFLNDIKHEIQP